MKLLIFQFSQKQDVEDLKEMSNGQHGLSSNVTLV